jgi:UDP-N-acetylmuramoyl-tripeptide--D-alanyl-D-alanine ligase
VTILDDTYNANPAGAAEALGALAGSGPSDLDVDPAKAHRRRVVVTPGMVELGSQPVRGESSAFGAAIAPVADRAPDRGPDQSPGPAGRRRIGTRDSLPGDAGAGPPPGGGVGSKCQLVPGDAVLYENDLPDHYP